MLAVTLVVTGAGGSVVGNAGCGGDDDVTGPVDAAVDAPIDTPPID